MSKEAVDRGGVGAENGGPVGPGGRARGGTGGEGRSGASGLIEVVVRDGVGLGGVMVGRLIEVARGVLLDDLVGIGGARLHEERAPAPATLAPARRATRVDPMEAIRTE